MEPYKTRLRNRKLIGAGLPTNVRWGRRIARISGARSVSGYYRCPFPPASFAHHELSFASLQSIMSTVPSTSTSHSNFASIFNAALESYKHKTNNDLASHPFLPSLQPCNSPEAILAALRERIPAFSQSQNGDDGLTKWVTPTVNVLYAFSSTVGQGVGLVSIKMNSREEFLS